MINIERNPHLSSDDRMKQLKAIQAGAQHFHITRNFPLDFDVKAGKPRLSPVLDSVLDLRHVEISPAELPTHVRMLSRSLADNYGGRERLSAATKFLWLVRKDAVVIYDENARSALAAPAGDYSEYLRLWFGSFEGLKKEIVDACDTLSNEALAGASAETWFHRRVHDIYLWNVGSK